MKTLYLIIPGIASTTLATPVVESIKRVGNAQQFGPFWAVTTIFSKEEITSRLAVEGHNVSIAAVDRNNSMLSSDLERFYDQAQKAA